MANSLIDSPGTFRPMLRLVTPVLIEHVMHLLVAYVDLFLTGRFLPGVAYVAAMTLVMYSVWFIANVFAFVALGATAMTARFVGAGNRPLANQVMHQALVTGLAWVGLLMVVTLPVVGDLVRSMGLDEEAAAAATRYLTVEICMLPAIMIMRVGIACLRGAGDTLSGMAAMAVVNAVNVCVSFLLVTGAGPAPELGWIGLPLGTAAGYCVGATIVLALLRAGRAGYHLRLSLLRPDVALIRRILRIGVPGGLDMLSINLCHLMYLRVINDLGDAASAAHGVALQIEALAYMPGAAFSIAASTLAGQYLGAQDIYRARRSVWLTCLAAGGVMVAAGVLFYVAAVPLASLFLGTHRYEVVALAARLLRIVAVAMFPLAVTMVLSGALRGAGDTRWPLMFNLGSMILVRVPLAAYLAHGAYVLPFIHVPIDGLALGVAGAWYAAVVDIVIRCLLMAGRFAQGGWQRIEV